MDQIMKSKWVGSAALTITVILWSSFAITMRAIGHSSLTTIDAAFIRFAIPALILAPRFIINQRKNKVKIESPTVVLAILVAGLPHYLSFATATHMTSASLSGLIVPGCVPFFVTVFILFRKSEVISRQRIIALIAIISGVGICVAINSTGNMRTGISIALVSSCLWTIYTFAIGKTKLDPFTLMFLVSSIATVEAFYLMASHLAPSNLLTGNFHLKDIALFVILQGLGTGILSTLAFVIAVQKLGKHIASATGALSPVLTALLAVPIFGERLTWQFGIALAMICLGVMRYNLAKGENRSVKLVPSVGVEPTLEGF